MVAVMCVVSASAQSKVKDAFGIDHDARCSLGLYAYNGGIHFWGTGVFNGGLTATYCF